jgi:predicted nuclease of predicted toxin-antitoxin system
LLDKLLFDQNISFKVPKKRRDIFPDARHLSVLGLEGAADLALWEFAKANNLVNKYFKS